MFSPQSYPLVLVLGRSIRHPDVFQISVKRQLIEDDHLGKEAAKRKVTSQYFHVDRNMCVVSTVAFATYLSPIVLIRAGLLENLAS